MCGRYVLRNPAEAIAALLGTASTDPAPTRLPSRYNVAPSQVLPAVRSTPKGRELALLRWGLVPRWAKDPAIGNRLINARAETVADKPSFREAFRRRRCAIPADGFYEWQPTSGRGKRPWLFTLAGGAPFAFAGLWESWKPSPDGEPLETFTILTTGANELVQPVHDRMPVILGAAELDRWLDPALAEPAELLRLVSPLPATRMEARPVRRLVNDPRYDGPECLEEEAG